MLVSVCPVLRSPPGIAVRTHRRNHCSFPHAQCTRFRSTDVMIPLPFFFVFLIIRCRISLEQFTAEQSRGRLIFSSIDYPRLTRISWNLHPGRRRVCRPRLKLCWCRGERMPTEEASLTTGYLALERGALLLVLAIKLKIRHLI